MATTDVSVCNSALIKIGAERITSLSDTTKRAILCNEQYPKLRDEVLRDGSWNFSKKRAALATTTAPTWGYAFAYELPTDCLKILEVDGTYDYSIEGTTLVTDMDEVSILYVSQVLDTSLFDAAFEEALALRLSAELAFALVQSVQLQATMMQAYMAKLAQAKSTNSQERYPQAIDQDSWLNVRN